MTTRIYIAIPVRERAPIAALCLPTIFETKASQDFMVLSNDGSKEFTNDWLFKFGDQIRQFNEPIGIQNQRRLHFQNFWEQRHAYTHLYLTDSDAPHDPGWRAQALGLQEENGGALTCLYNTKAHTAMVGNVLENDPLKDHLWQKVAPGISYLLTHAHVEKVMKVIDTLDHFDWTVPSILGNRCCISAVSYCDHIGYGGERHPAGAGLDGGDRATAPTRWLVEKRKEIVAALGKVYRDA
jgi:hypothetical protein